MTDVLLFAKAPRPGFAKTRLAAEIGVARALAAYRDVGRTVAGALGERFPLTVWYDPPDAEAEMRAWLGPHRYRAQVGPDLGARMAHAFGEHFQRGGTPVVAVGADTPGVDADTIAAATAALERADVALGPAVDGGYYLIGLRRPADALFVGVPWGGPRVMRVTLDTCAKAHLTVERLAPKRDVDTADDLAALGFGLT